MTENTNSDSAPTVANLGLKFYSHATLECKDIGFTRRFFREFLGFETVQMSTNAFWARLGGSQVIVVVQGNGKNVTDEDVAAAREKGASDNEIHDTVLIAAAFCMYNRYVDGLATTQPQDEALYRERGRQVAELGYVSASKIYLKEHAVAR